MGENSKAIGLVIIFSVILFLGGVSHAQTLGGVGTFFRSGVDARALGMGGAFVALANNYSASYWNPAGLASLNKPRIGGTHVNLFGVPGLGYDFISGNAKIQTISLAGTYTGLGTSYQANNQVLSYQERLYLISLAYDLSPLGLIGGSIKRYSIAAPGGGVGGKTASASGLGIDIGILESFTSKLKVGLSAFDLTGTDVKWKNTPLEPTNTIPTTIKVGVSYLLSSVNTTLGLEYDLEGMVNDTIRAGAEFKPTSLLAIRAGGIKPLEGNLSYTMGAGVHVENLRINFAWVQNLTGLKEAPNAGDTILLSGEFTFS